MKTKSEYNVKLPDYSLPYLVNNDASGLDNADKNRIDQFMNQFYDEAKSVLGSVVISPSEEESYFTWNPAFGLACNVTDTTILILVN